jgi:hypothetical protein
MRRSDVTAITPHPRRPGRPGLRHLGAGIGGLILAIAVSLASCGSDAPLPREKATTAAAGEAPLNAPDLPVPLVAHSACAEAGRIWVTGVGEDADRVFVSWAPPEKSWRKEGALPFESAFHGMCAAGGGLYVAGGLPDHAKAWRCDLARGAWRQLPPLPTPRSRTRAVECGGLIYVVGGYVGGGATPGNTGACEAYDPATDAWTRRAPMPTPRHGHTLVVLGGRLVVTGGGDGETARAETYDPSTNTWTSLSPCPRVYPLEASGGSDGPRRPFNLLFHEAVVWDDRVLHFGAREDAPIPVLSWDPARDAWHIEVERGPLRHRMASARLGSTLYLLGGESSAREGPHALRDVLAVDLRAIGGRSR